ncbi:MAG: polyprenyl synthetase family protein [Bacteroidota bacterium]
MKDHGLVRYQKVYLRELKKFENVISKLFSKSEPHSLYEPCSYAIKSGGKRIRPFLVLFSAKALKGKYSDVYNAAVAVELLHNFTLVHDDIMDNSDKRRGRPTLHKKYNNNTAILTGDNLNGLAYKYLLKDVKNDSKKILSTFTQGIIEVCEGQSLDKEFESRKSVSITEYKTMIYKKTAALAEMCCSIGAQLVHGNEKQVSALANYGKNLGMAFQIQDDLLDIIGKEKEFGKKIGSDLIEGKKTYLFLRALEKANKDEKKLLYIVIKNRGIQQKEVGSFKKLYEKLGVISDAKKEIVHYTNNALKNLSVLPDNEGKNMLVWLANSLINRTN